VGQAILSASCLMLEAKCCLPTLAATISTTHCDETQRHDSHDDKFHLALLPWEHVRAPKTSQQPCRRVHTT